MKRRQEFDPAEGRPQKWPGGKGRIDMPCVLKFLMPEALASAVIGKGGSVIKGIRDATGAKLVLTEHNELFPGTDSRICTAQATSEEALTEVSAQIAAKVFECAQVTPSESLGHGNELRLRVLVPRTAVGGVIGKGGAVIKLLREQSGAKVSISDAEAPGPGADQVVTITGTQQAIEYVMAEVNKQVQALNGEPWFQTWASTSPLTTVASGCGGVRADLGRNGQGALAVWTGAGAGVAPAAGGAGVGGASVEIMVNVARAMPQYVLEDSRGFALSCVVPNRLVGGLIGRGGSGTKEVQNLTSTKIGIREIPGDPDNRSMNIAGPLSNTCAAYMLMMKRYLDAEAQAAEAFSSSHFVRQGHRPL